MIDSAMHCSCGKYEERKVVIDGYAEFDLDYTKMLVCKNCGLLPPIKTPGLFIQGDTYQGDDNRIVSIPVIEFKCLRSSAIVPRRATTHAYCYDVYASIGETFGSSNHINVAPDKSVAIGIGFSVRVDEGYGMKIYSRSGQAYKNRVSLTNSVGIIDADYGKEVMVMLTNHGIENFRVSNGQAIAQIEIQKHQEFSIKLVTDLTPVLSNRDGGFGSTDKDHE